MARGRRKRIAEGVYEDQSGWASTVKVGTRQREQRFPVGTSLEFIAAWRRETRDQLIDDREDAEKAGTAPPPPGTFAGDLVTYEKTIAHRVGYKSDRSHLRAWLPTIGPLARRKVRPSHAKTMIQAWQTAAKSARTIRHRVRVLRELWRHFDGPHAPTPVLGLMLPKPPAPHPVAVPWATVQAVASSLKRGLVGTKGHGPKRTKAKIHYAASVKNYARFLVRATTGQRPTQIMRALPDDVDLQRKIWFVRAAKGGVAIALPLDAHGVKAWKTFIAAKAWGNFNVSSFAHLLRRHGWPKDVRPYSLRSTFAIDLILGGADLGDVQGMLGHRQIETTRTHYAPILIARLRRAGKQRKGRTLG